MQWRSECQPVELPMERLDHARVAMAERGDEDAADRVEVALAVNVPVIETVGAVDNQWVLGELGRLREIDVGAAKEFFVWGCGGAGHG